MINAAARLAPYGDVAIRLSLTSSTTSAYRPLHCLECGRTFLEREGAYYWRNNGQNQSSPAVIDAFGIIVTTCHNCQQTYTLNFSFTTSRAIVPLNQQTQSIYFAPETTKAPRITRCLECGKGFAGIADRISQVVDNVTPVQFQDPARLAPFQAVCEFSRCRQRWAFVV